MRKWGHFLCNCFIIASIAGGAGMLKLPFSPNIASTAASNRFERKITFVIFS